MARISNQNSRRLLWNCRVFTPARSRPSRGKVGAVISLVAATIFWAGNYIVGAGAVHALDPLSLVVLRWALALVPLLVLTQVLERPNWAQVLKAWPWMLALSAFGLAGYNLLLYAALQHTDALSAALINAFNPALITLAAVAFLRERLTGGAIAGILVALVGVLLVLSNGNLLALAAIGPTPGNLLMVGAIVAWTAYAITGRLAPPVPPITSTALQAAVATIVLGPFALATHALKLPGSAQSIASLVFIAVFPSVLSYLLWNRALGRIPAASAGVFLNLITVFTAVFTLVTGGAFTVAKLVGGLIVLAGVVLTNNPARRKAKPTSAPLAADAA